MLYPISVKSASTYIPSCNFSLVLIITLPKQKKQLNNSWNWSKSIAEASTMVEPKSSATQRQAKDAIKQRRTISIAKTVTFAGSSSKEKQEKKQGSKQSGAKTRVSSGAIRRPGRRKSFAGCKGSGKRAFLAVCSPRRVESSWEQSRWQTVGKS